MKKYILKLNSSDLVQFHWKTYNPTTTFISLARILSIFIVIVAAKNICEFAADFFIFTPMFEITQHLNSILILVSLLNSVHANIMWRNNYFIQFTTVDASVSKTSAIICREFISTILGFDDDVIEQKYHRHFDSRYLIRNWTDLYALCLLLHF